MIDLTPYLSELLLVSISMFFAVITPGPDFAMVLKQSITYGKKASIYASLGIGVGISIHIIYTILGIGLIISKSIILFNIIKFMGALYLIYLGYKSIKSSSFKLEINETIEYKKLSNTKSFMQGFLCNALNPKATLFFISLFTIIVKIDTPFYIQSIYGLFCILITISWFVFLSLVLSHHSVKNFFNNFGKWFDRTIGIVLISLGIKIALSN